MTATIDLRLLAARKPLEELRRDLSETEGLDPEENALLDNWRRLVAESIAALDRAQQESM